MTDSATAELIPEESAAQRRWQRSSGGYLASAWIPVGFCILVIAAESTVFFGADHTAGPLQRFCEMFFGPFTQPQWWRIHISIRKWGHFTGYGILSAACFRAFWMTWRTWAVPPRRQWTAHGLAMLGTLAVASADEFHQLFLPNRTGSAWDVALDCCGGLVMQLLIGMWMQRRFSGRKHS